VQANKKNAPDISGAFWFCNINQIHAGIGQLGKLFQIVAAINDAGVEEGRGF
jgi:hypothetical protein